jgi:hypothetical protein
MEQLPLKDIHLPEAIGWWPPAPGWWLLPLVVVLLWLVVRYLYQRLTRKTAIHTAQTLLKNLSKQTDALQTLTALSALLRRTAISIDGRSHVAGLRGIDWLEYLDRSLPEQPFSQGIGRCLADAHYRPRVADDIDLPALIALCERWLKQQGKKS